MYNMKVLIFKFDFMRTESNPSSGWGWGRGVDFLQLVKISVSILTIHYLDFSTIFNKIYINYSLE